MLANDDLHKVALMLTDSVFYDGDRPKIAAQGLSSLGVLTYALGISIAENGINMGMTKADIETQYKQLMAFVHNHADRFLNFGEEGYHLLTEIAQSIIDRLLDDVEKTLPRIIQQPYWCCWWSPTRCLNTDPETFNSAAYCKWIPANPAKPTGQVQCLDKNWCNWKTKAICLSDSYCTYSMNTTSNALSCQPKF